MIKKLEVLIDTESQVMNSILIRFIEEKLKELGLHVIIAELENVENNDKTNCMYSR